MALTLGAPAQPVLQSINTIQTSQTQTSFIRPCCLGCFSYPSSMVAIRKKHNDATSPVFRQRLSFHDGDFPISFIQVLGSPQPKEPVNSHGDVKTNIHLHTFAILQSSVPSGKLT